MPHRESNRIRLAVALLGVAALGLVVWLVSRSGDRPTPGRGSPQAAPLDAAPTGGTAKHVPTDFGFDEAGRLVLLEPSRVTVVATDGTRTEKRLEANQTATLLRTARDSRLVRYVAVTSSSTDRAHVSLLDSELHEVATLAAHERELDAGNRPQQPSRYLDASAEAGIEERRASDGMITAVFAVGRTRGLTRFDVDDGGVSAIDHVHLTTSESAAVVCYRDDSGPKSAVFSIGEAAGQPDVRRSHRVRMASPAVNYVGSHDDTVVGEYRYFLESQRWLVKEAVLTGDVHARSAVACPGPALRVPEEAARPLNLQVAEDGNRALFTCGGDAVIFDLAQGRPVSRLPGAAGGADGMGFITSTRFSTDSLGVSACGSLAIFSLADRTTLCADQERRCPFDSPAEDLALLRRDQDAGADALPPKGAEIPSCSSPESTTLLLRHLDALPALLPHMRASFDARRYAVLGNGDVALYEVGTSRVLRIGL